MTLKVKFFNKQLSLGIIDYVNIINYYMEGKDSLISIIWYPNNIGFSFNKYILTVHDLIGLRPDYSEKRLKKIIRFILLYISMMFAEVIITVSNTVKSEITRKFKFINKNKIITIISGFNYPDFDEPDIINKFLDYEYMLTISNRLPHKNIDLLIEAYDITLHPNLVIVGQLSKNQKMNCKKKKILVLDHLSKMELKSAIKSCLCMISTSLEEGFGMPAAIARHYRRPLLLSDIDVYRELHGDYAHFFSEIYQLKEMMKRENIKHSHLDEALPTWKDVAQQYYEIIRKI